MLCDTTAKSKRVLTSLVNRLLMVYKTLYKTKCALKRSTLNRWVNRLSRFPALPNNKRLRETYCACCLLICEIKRAKYSNNSYFEDTFDAMMKCFYSYLSYDIFHKALRHGMAVWWIPTNNKRKDRLHVLFDGYMRVVCLDLNREVDEAFVPMTFETNWRGKNFCYSFTGDYIPIIGWHRLKLKLWSDTDMYRKDLLRENSSIYFNWLDFHSYLSIETVDDMLFYDHGCTWPPIDYDCLANYCQFKLNHECKDVVQSYVQRQCQKAKRHSFNLLSYIA